MVQHGYRADSTECVVEIDLGPNCEWRAQMQWPKGKTQGGPAVLLVHPAGPESADTVPDGGISHTILREIDFRSALDALRRALDSADKWQQSREESEQRVIDLLKQHAAIPSVTDDYLALLSRVYVGAVNRGQSKPLEHLAEETGKSPAAIKNHLWQATRKGLLERSPGRAGGSVTQKAAGLLKPLLNAARQEQGLPPLDSGETLREALQRMSDA